MNLFVHFFRKIQCLTVALSAVLLVFTCATSQAQRLISKLPEDGSWAKYEMKGATTTSNGNINKNSATMIVRVVGTEHMNMDAYRWVEIEQRQDHIKNSMPSIYRFLIKEDDITNGEDPLAHIKKCWTISLAPNLDIVKEYDVKKDSLQFLEWFLPPQLEKQKTLEPKTLKTSLGELECKGASGVYDQSRAPNYIQRHTFTVYAHDKCPFGTVSLHRLTEAIIDKATNHKLEYTFELKETGTGAKSLVGDLK